MRVGFFLVFLGVSDVKVKEKTLWKIQFRLHGVATHRSSVFHFLFIHLSGFTTWLNKNQAAKWLLISSISHLHFTIPPHKAHL